MNKKEEEKIQCKNCKKFFTVCQLRLLLSRSCYKNGIAGVVKENSELFCIECANSIQTLNPSLIAVALGVENE